jgi:hypothetical protein
MPIPELERKRAEVELRRFCDRVPPHIRGEFSYDWTVRGNQITLLERRPAFQRPGEFTEHRFARFQFNPSSHSWTLKWSDRNGRFHVYEGLESVHQFSDLVKEVESDPTGIFLG